ncbi:MAG: hypothetical protein M1352_01445 [Patescibacteria group bacterium]|nr:hypothetical protein [Patescibacteria group bacterium]
MVKKRLLLWQILIAILFSATSWVSAPSITKAVNFEAACGSYGQGLGWPGRCPQPACSTNGKQCINCGFLQAGNANIIDGYTCLNIPAPQPLPTELNTEIGTLKPQPEELIKALILIMSGLAGGVSLFLLISGAAKYLLSGGNPDAIDEAKSTITHAIGGFLLVFLSVFLLRFIGIDILHIPGFTPAPGGGVNVPYP